MELRFERKHSLCRLKMDLLVEYCCDASRDVYLRGEESGA